MRYTPELSDTAVRTFSMRAGLVASTVTPGRMAPEGALTIPVITACADAAVGRRTIQASTASFNAARIVHLACGWSGREGPYSMLDGSLFTLILRLLRT